MAADTVFAFVAEQLERESDLDRLESRGTVRLALKEAGLDAATVSVSQMTVVLEKVLPNELATRGVDDPPAICGRILAAIAGFRGSAPTSDDSSPEAVFERIGGR